MRSSLPRSMSVLLGAAFGVVGGAAVAHADVEVAVGPELELAAVVVRVGLRDGQQDPRARRVGLVGIAGGDVVAGDDRIALEIRIVDEEEAVVGVVGVERDREQAALAVGRRSCRGCRGRAAGADVAAVLRRIRMRPVADGQEEPGVAGVGDAGDRAEVVRDLLQVDPAERRRRRGRARSRAPGSAAGRPAKAAPAIQAGGAR